MFILIVLALALVISLRRGGKLRNLSLVHIRWRGVIILGFLLQVLIFSSFWKELDPTPEMTSAMHLVSLALLLNALIVNLSLPGLWLMTVGFCLNFIAIAFNGGYMPSYNMARALAGMPLLAPGQIRGNSIGMGPNTPLAWLGDMFAIPDVFMLANVFSIGDILIAVGAFLLIQETMVDPAPSYT
jgi:hypothetical protein